jgi:spore coat assembly protein SafA
MSVQIPPPPASCSGFIYTVVSGDTLFFIAQRFGVSFNAIIAANPQIPNPNLIFPGQRICVPSGAPPIPVIECCMLLFRTANVPILPGAEAGGVARVVQNSQEGNVLVSTIGLPPPSSLGGNVYVAWIRRPGFPPIPFQLYQTGPVVIEPGVWVGAILFGPGEQFAPFQDIVVTAEVSPPFITPNLTRIALIDQFAQCQPR